MIFRLMQVESLNRLSPSATSNNSESRLKVTETAGTPV